MSWYDSNGSAVALGRWAVLEVERINGSRWGWQVFHGMSAGRRMYGQGSAFSKAGAKLCAELIDDALADEKGRR